AETGRLRLFRQQGRRGVCARGARGGTIRPAAARSLFLCGVGLWRFSRLAAERSEHGGAIQRPAISGGSPGLADAAWKATGAIAGGQRRPHYRGAGGERIWFLRQGPRLYGRYSSHADRRGIYQGATLYSGRSGSGSKRLIAGAAGGDQFWPWKRAEIFCQAEKAAPERPHDDRRILGRVVRPLGRAAYGRYAGSTSQRSGLDVAPGIFGEPVYVPWRNELWLDEWGKFQRHDV